MEKEDERLKKLQLEAESHFILSSEAGMGCPWALLSPWGHRVATGTRTAGSASPGNLGPM